MGDRLAGRPGASAPVRLRGPEHVLTLRLDGRRLVAEALREVRGVVIARQTPPLAAWLELFAGQLHALAAEAAGDSRRRDARARGARRRRAGVRPGRRRGRRRRRAARAAAAAGRPCPGRRRRAGVERITGLLADTLPRVAGAFEQEQAVRRTATDYLPRTLQAYAALPAGWARDAPAADGSTALEALRGQLAVLEQAAARMHDAAVDADASALLANGSFLADRFATSALELPD